MTDKRKRKIINEVIPNGERITETEFINRITERIVALVEEDEHKAREYAELAGEFLSKRPDFAKEYCAKIKALTPTVEEFNARLAARCAACEIKEWAIEDSAARAVCERCHSVMEQLKAEYSKMPSKTAQDGQGAAVGISTTSAKKRQESPFAEWETSK